MYSIHHDLECESCGASLTSLGAVIAHFSDGNHEINTVYSQVDKEGLLIDVTGQIGIGMHSGSTCAGCDEQLDEI